jgi:hypothetical protein
MSETVSNEIVKELECAIGIDNHYFKVPICLSPCGHSICKECVPKEKNESIKCKICGELNIRDLNNEKESKFAMKTIQWNLDSLFDVLEERLTLSLNKLKGIILRHDFE